MGRIATDLLVQDATVPRSHLPEVLMKISEIGERYDLNIANVFHAGDGNLHPNILFDRSDAEELEKVELASTEIMKVCVDAGGTITGEHGIGLQKKEYLVKQHPDNIPLMKMIKKSFDPNNILNPGKVFDI